MRLPDKNITESATMQGGAVAALAGLVYLWGAVFGWDDTLIQALTGTVGALGTFWALYGLRRRA